MIGSPLAGAYEAPGRGYHWGMATFHPTLPRGARVNVGQKATLREILVGPAHENDGTLNLFGALRTSMATTGLRHGQGVPEGRGHGGAGAAHRGQVAPAGPGHRHGPLSGGCRRRDDRRDRVSDAAVGVLARGMRDNPLHVAAFGDDPRPPRRRADTRMFHGVIPMQPEPAAREGRRYARRRLRVRARPPMCVSHVFGGLPAEQFPPFTDDRRRAGPRWSSGSRLGRQRDPDEPHFHLGPVAADAGRQGQGIGTAMMQRVLRPGRPRRRARLPRDRQGRERAASTRGSGSRPWARAPSSA